MKVAFGLRRRSIVVLLKRTRNDETENGLLLLAFDSFQRFEGGSANGGVFPIFFALLMRLQTCSANDNADEDDPRRGLYYIINIPSFIHSLIHSLL